MLSIRKIGFMGRTYRHLHRYRQILGVLFKYGFGDLIERLKIEQYLEIGIQVISRKKRVHAESHSRAERVRMALVELGPTFIKLGQMLSTRPDLVSVEFITELAKLQDRVPPFPFSEVRAILESELKAPISELFEEIDETPLAAASIAQVHRAVLKSGEAVVLKVERPDIRRTVEVDLEILLHLASLMERHIEGIGSYQPIKIVEAFARNIELELDFNIEASHVERFAQQFMGEHAIYVPKVFRETTTSRVLTLEYVDALKASEMDQLRAAGLDFKRIARQGADLLLKQAFVHGFFHADPHPGNILILPDYVICFIDYGNMGSIDLKTREGFTDLITGVVEHDPTEVAEALLALTLWEEEPDRRALERELEAFIDKYSYRPLGDLNLGNIILELLEVTARYGMWLEPSLFLMLKAICTIEDLGKKLDPAFDITARLEPFLKQIKMARLHPRRIAGEMVESGMEMAALLKAIPTEVRELLRLAKRGKMKFEFEHQGLRPLLLTLTRISNRISFSIVLAALLIASSLIVLSKIPPLVFEIPVIGLVGYIVAGIMGLWLLIGTLRKGNM